VIVGTAHHDYLDSGPIRSAAPRLRGIVDACNAYSHADVVAAITRAGIGYAGIGRGRVAPSDALLDAVVEGFRAMETGVGNEVDTLCAFLNARYAGDEFGRARFSEVQRIAGTCVTGCAIADAGVVAAAASADPFRSRLATLARPAVESRPIPVAVGA
jgi:hypothetical protein